MSDRIYTTYGPNSGLGDEPSDEDALTASLRRLHRAVGKRMMAGDDADGDTRIELLNAWTEAGDFLD